MRKQRHSPLQLVDTIATDHTATVVDRRTEKSDHRQTEDRIASNAKSKNTVKHRRQERLRVAHSGRYVYSSAGRRC